MAVRQSAEQSFGVRSRTPDVEGVVGDQARVEQVGQALLGVGSERRERDTHRLGHVDNQGPLGSGVVDGGDAGPGPSRRRGPAPGGEELEGVAHLVEVGHPDDAVGLEQRLPGAVGPGQRAGVGGHHGPAGRR